LWSKVVSGPSSSVHEQAWPQPDNTKVELSERTIVVMVDGKKQSLARVPSKIALDEHDLRSFIQASPEGIAAVNRRAVQSTIVVPGKLVNFVTSQK